jgi:hypothetical protein
LIRGTVLALRKEETNLVKVSHWIYYLKVYLN